MENNLGNAFLSSAIKRLKYYKDLGDKTFEQLDEQGFYYQPNEASNSIAVIIQHMSGNMLSRWTNFLTEDGEKKWRNRDIEFESHSYNKEELVAIWEKGWTMLLSTLQQLTPNHLLQTVFIRSEPLTVVDAINRQLAHYPYHVGQIVYLGRLVKNASWKTLSIEKGKSADFNNSMVTGK